MHRNGLFMVVAIFLAPPAFPEEGAGRSVVNMSGDAIRSDAAALPEHGFLSTGQPDAQVLQKIADAGFVAVIDLRTAEEDRGMDEQAEVERLGMQYVSLPIAGSADMNFDNAARLDRLLADIDGPVLLHCGSGNRVGALFALRAGLQGGSDAEALETGRVAGMTRSTAVVEKRLQEASQE